MIERNKLIELLRYEPETGHLFWLARERNKTRPAGEINIYGYCIIKVLGKRYRAHRLAWLIHFGEWPNGILDHINGNRSDNRIENLRLVSRNQHSINKSIQSNNKLGVKGVHYDKSRNKFCAFIKLNGKNKNLGRFDNLNDAKNAYDHAALAFGEFRRVDEANLGYTNHY